MGEDIADQLVTQQQLAMKMLHIVVLFSTWILQVSLDCFFQKPVTDFRKRIKYPEVY